jgi:hypothetical protein
MTESDTPGVVPDEQPNRKNDDTGRQRSESGSIRDWLADNLLLTIGAAMVVGGLVTFLGVDVAIPRFWYVFGLSAVVVSPVGWIVGLKAKEFLIDPNNIWVVDLDARYTDGALYRFPYSDYREFDVVDGEVDQVTPNLAIAKEVDIDAGEMRGCWRGTLTDRELLTALEMVHVCRGQLEDDARIGFTLKNRLWAVVRSATADSVRRIVETFEAGSLPDSGDSLHKHVDEAIDHHDVDQFVDDLPDVDLDPEEAELDPEQWPDDIGNPQTASVGGSNE